MQGAPDDSTIWTRGHYGSVHERRHRRAIGGQHHAGTSGYPQPRPDHVHLLFHVLRRGEPDLPAVPRGAGRIGHAAGRRRVHHLRGRPAGTRRAGRILSRRIRISGRPRLPQVRHRAGAGHHPDHRPLLRHPPHRHHLVRDDGGSLHDRHPHLDHSTHLFGGVLHPLVPPRAASGDPFENPGTVHGAAAARDDRRAVRGLPDHPARRLPRTERRLRAAAAVPRVPGRLPDHGSAGGAVLRHRHLRQRQADGHHQRLPEPPRNRLRGTRHRHPARGDLRRARLHRHGLRLDHPGRPGHRHRRHRADESLAPPTPAPPC